MNCHGAEHVIQPRRILFQQLFKTDTKSKLTKPLKVYKLTSRTDLPQILYIKPSRGLFISNTFERGGGGSIETGRLFK